MNVSQGMTGRLMRVTALSTDAVIVFMLLLSNLTDGCFTGDDGEADEGDNFEPLQLQLEDNIFAPIEACGGEFLNSLGKHWVFLFIDIDNLKCFILLLFAFDILMMVLC